MERMQYRRDLQGISFYKEAQFQYLRALHHQNDYWRQRAKQLWLKEGDTNSSFFHNAVKRRRQTNNIAGLKDENGTWIERGTGLDTLVTSHFSSLFKSSGGLSNCVLDCIESKLSDADNSFLSRRVVLQEVKEALFDMKPDKSRGPDGLNPGFF